MRYIEIDKGLIPYEFEISLAGELFKFEVNYNEEFDYFTINLYKNDEVLMLGEKIVCARPLFMTCLEKPNVDILPFDTTGKIERVTFENMNEEVFLFLVGDDDGTV